MMRALIIRGIDWIKYAWHRHGPIGCIQLIIYNLVYHARYYIQRVAMPPELDEFDNKYGTDTSGIREIRTLDAAKLPNARYAVRYGPSSAQVVHSVIEKLEI